MSEKERSHSAEGEEQPAGGFAPAELPLPPLPRPPFWMVAFALISIVLTWLPLAIIARARVSKSAEPRVQIMQDMGTQPKLREQMANPLFADTREMRPKIPGTVSRTDLEIDDHYYRGFIRVYDPYTGKWSVRFLDGLPVKLTQQLLLRGQQRFNIYCYVCHGYDGSGHGPVNEDAMQLKANGISGMGGWSQAATITEARVRQQKDGQIFNTITNGYRTMPAYGLQIPVADRWAIVAYLRALQFTQSAPVSVVPPEMKAKLNGE
jgi:mono/diheme cytochrome c family protein